MPLLALGGEKKARAYRVGPLVVLEAGLCIADKKSLCTYLTEEEQIGLMEALLELRGTVLLRDGVALNSLAGLMLDTLKKTLEEIMDIARAVAANYQELATQSTVATDEYEERAKEMQRQAIDAEMALKKLNELIDLIKGAGDMEQVEKEEDEEERG